MSQELKQIATNVDVTVTTLWQIPLKLTATDNTITIYPSTAPLYTTCDDKIYMDVPRTKQITVPAYVLKLENSCTVQAQYLEVKSWKLLYPPFEVMPSADTTPITITLHRETGTFIASRNCYVGILVEAHDVIIGYREYTINEHAVLPQGINIVGVAYTVYKNPNLPQGLPPNIQQVQMCDIPVSGGIASEISRITLPTVITPEGEWFMPENFTSPGYDQANAYGEGVKGPSKDEGWVARNVPLESTHYAKGVGAKYIQHPVPSNVQGVVKVPLVQHVAIRPDPPGTKPGEGNETEQKTIAADRNLAYKDNSLSTNKAPEIVNLGWA